MFKQSTLMDKGTLYQLKNTINRTSVPADPAANMKAAEDFDEVIQALIIAASKDIIAQQDIESLSQLADSVVSSYFLLERDESRSTRSDGVCVCV